MPRRHLAGGRAGPVGAGVLRRLPGERERVVRGDATWSNYPYFDQKRVVAVSSMDLGGSSSSPVSAPWAAADTDDQDAARGALLTDGSSMAIAVRTTTRGCMR
jgi:hypothetical protein